MAGILDTLKQASTSAYDWEKKYLPTSDPTSLLYQSLIGMGKYASSFFPKAPTTTAMTDTGGAGGGGGGGGAGGGAPPPTPPPTTQTNLAGGGAAGGGVGSTSVSGGVSGVGGPSDDPYAKAMEATQATIPLIQQRYQSLWNEIDRATAESAAGQETATKSSIGEARARSAAAGVYSGSTELGTESVLRKQAADTIAQIKATGASQKAQSVAQEAIDIGTVTKDLANLGISKYESDQKAYQYAQDYILKERQLAIDAAQAGKGVVAQTAEGVMLVNPYTGQTIARIGSPKSVSTGQQAITSQLGQDVVAGINASPIKDQTGTAKALEVYAKLQVPVVGQMFLTPEEAQYKQLQGYFFSLQQAAIKAIQGTRPSDYDAISYAKNVGLSITNSPAANEVAVNQLLNLVGGGSVGGGADTGSDPLGIL